jgi:hypothetical protein
LLRIRAASVNAADWHIMRANHFFARLALGLLRPSSRSSGPTWPGRSRPWEQR